jgi:hypothetical protein
MRIAIEEVPLELRRRAAQHLESLRGSELAAGADRAQLSGRVCPIFRPDLDEPAYYEFEVDLAAQRPVRLLTGDAVRDLTPAATALSTGLSNEDLLRRIGRPELGKKPAQGFLILAAGPHDVPLPHWSLERPPVSQQLEAEARRADAKVARVVKVDSLAYVGEDADGQMVANVGQLPLMLEGLPALEEYRGAISSLEAIPRQRTKDDREAGEGEVDLVREGPKPPELRFVDPERWERFRDGFGEQLGPFLEQLERSAAEAWETERLVAEFGEGIYTGTTHRVALLQADAAIEVTGEAAKLIKVALLDRQGGPPAIEITVPPVKAQLRSRAVSPEPTASSEPTMAGPADAERITRGVQAIDLDREASFEIHIAYRDGTEEHLPFFIVPPDAASDRRGDERGGRR